MMTYALLGEDPPPPQQPPGFGPLFPFFLLGVVVLYLVLVALPGNRRQQREQAQLLANMKRGTKVLTNAMIVGTVVSVKDGEDEIVIKSEDSRLRIKRSAVVQVIGTDEAEAGKS